MDKPTEVLETLWPDYPAMLADAILLEKQHELEEIILNDAHVDKQLAFLITQMVDFRAKLSAIKEYNSLKKRITRTVVVEATLAQAVHQAMQDDG